MSITGGIPRDVLESAGTIPDMVIDGLGWWVEGEPHPDDDQYRIPTEDGWLDEIEAVRPETRAHVALVRARVAQARRRRTQ